MLSRLSCACILEKHVIKTDIKHWSVVLFSSFCGPFYRVSMFGNAYSVDLYSPWTKNPWTFFPLVADFSVAVFSVDLLTVDLIVSTLLYGGVAILCTALRTTNHVLEPSIDWSLYINAKKKKKKIFGHQWGVILNQWGLNFKAPSKLNTGHL